MHLTSITSGSDGALWFDECSPIQPGGIGRITTGGAYTFFPVGCQNLVTSGPDGNIWFSDGAYVYSMTTSGVIVGKFTLGDQTLNGATTGSDGALWFIGSALDGSPRLIRVTVAGVVTQVAGPGIQISVVSGPDGMLWILNRDGYFTFLDRFDPNSMTFVSEVKNALRQAYGPIASGPDGNIWEAGARLPNDPNGAGAVLTYVRQAMVLSPERLTVPVGQTANLTVSEANYLGQWTAISKAPSIATVTFNSNNGVFVVTGVAVGTTYITVFDTDYNLVKVKVTVQ
jgi:streptogramin lyase